MEGWALLVKVRVALAAPVVSGLKVMVKLALCPAGIVWGSEKPPIVKTELFVLAPVTVTVAPLAVKLPVAVPLDPTITLPSGRVLGDTVSCPTATVTPLPDTGTVRVGLLAVEVIVRLPLAAPAAAGENETVNVALCPALIVNGVVMPLTLNPVVTPT